MYVNLINRFEFLFQIFHVIRSDQSPWGKTTCKLVNWVHIWETGLTYHTVLHKINIHQKKGKGNLSKLFSKLVLMKYIISNIKYKIIYMASAKVDQHALTVTVKYIQLI